MAFLSSVLDSSQPWHAEEVNSVGEFSASLARVIIRIYGVKTMLYLMCVMALQIIVAQTYSVFLVQKALSYFQWVQSYYHQHGILPDLREPLFVAMAVFSALPLSNIAPQQRPPGPWNHLHVTHVSRTLRTADTKTSSTFC